MAGKVRLGRIEYLNVLPVYFALENLFGENGFHLVSGTPAELNALLRRGDLDASSISSLEYGRCPQDYLLLADLSISSRGAVGSVLLFSRVPFRELEGRPILVSKASATGAALLRVLLAELFQVVPDCRPGPATAGAKAGCAAVLAIGDEALQMKARGVWPYCLDLGAAWLELTGLPFVFGVWAVRREFAAARPETVAALHGLLLRSRAWGLGALPYLSVIAAARLGQAPAQVLDYFQHLDYGLGPDYEKGLTSYFHYLRKLGELEEEPQLEYFRRGR
jgi:chorismate dehydratase